MRNKNSKRALPKGRNCSQKEVRKVLQEYIERTSNVKENMDWEDYLNLIDIVTYVNTNSGIDLAFRIGYMTGKESLIKKIEGGFLKGGANND